MGEILRSLLDYVLGMARGTMGFVGSDAVFRSVFIDDGLDSTFLICLTSLIGS